LLVLSFLCCRSAARYTELRVPLAVYVGAYALTTGIGAIAIGLAGPEVMPAKWGMDLSYILEVGPQYWPIAFMPFIVPPLAAMVVERIRLPQPQPAPHDLDGTSLSLLAIVTTFAACGGFCVYRLVSTGYVTTLADIGEMTGEFQALMVLRSDMMSSLGNLFFGIVYTTLPTICHCTLYVAAKRRRAFVWILYFAMLGMTALLCVAVVQKTLILVLLAFTAVAFVELELVSWRIFGLAALGGVGLLGSMQLVFQGESWTMLDSLALLIFRMSSAFPYYLNLYPNVLPYGGIDLGLNVVGLATPPRDPLDVHEHIYPRVDIEGAAAPAAAHVRAYSQAGLPWSIITAIAIGVAIYIAARSRRRVRGPLSFALHIQLLVLVYYLTQTSIVEAITSSYGLIWTVLGVATVATVNVVFRRGHAPEQPVNSTIANGG
jgi:hypothetical protein